MKLKNICKKVLRGEVSTEKLIEKGLKVGINFNRRERVVLDYSHCWLIEIGDNVTIAPDVHILAHDASTKMFLGYTKIGRVRIGDNVFIGAGSIILPNVTIGDNVIIGAGSVVTKDIMSNSVVAGNPACRICSLDAYLEKNSKKIQDGPLYDESYTMSGGITTEKKKQMKKDLDKNGGFVV